MPDIINTEKIESATVSYEATSTYFKKIETPAKIMPIETVYDIEEIRRRIAKNTNARDQWTALIEKDQAILDLYNSTEKVEVKIEEMPVEEKPVEEAAEPEGLVGL